jgi:hypothetical protein
MRIILIGVMLLAATSASADWVKVTETTDTAYYVDPASSATSPVFVGYPSSTTTRSRSPVGRAPGECHTTSIAPGNA